ncbi:MULTISPECIES: hypothetical protein [Paenibacillus]|uniref:Uncharacterized protein n=3 Tax=Paenibacillus TaxID=44249 RepID=A0A7X2ZF82_9BACL|nr:MULTISPECIES: hypothetical protein [Paenibacillus]MUG73759.1 hypothetical protein [Paenibacillus validus]
MIVPFAAWGAGPVASTEAASLLVQDQDEPVWPKPLTYLDLGDSLAAGDDAAAKKMNLRRSRTLQGLKRPCC